MPAVMKELKGKADGKAVQEAVKKFLGCRSSIEMSGYISQ